MTNMAAYEKLLHAFEESRVFEVSQVVPGVSLELKGAHETVVLSVDARVLSTIESQAAIARLGRGGLLAPLLKASINLTLAKIADDPSARALTLDFNDEGALQVRQSPRPQ